VTHIKFVALSAGAGALMTAGSLVNAPVAKADCNPFEGCYGAATASPTAGDAELVTNYGEQSHAEEHALLECNVMGKTNDCQLLVSGLAVSPSQAATAPMPEVLRGRKTQPTQTRCRSCLPEPKSNSVDAISGADQTRCPCPARVRTG
jgi:hypothetical protein